MPSLPIWLDACGAVGRAKGRLALGKAKHKDLQLDVWVSGGSGAFKYVEGRSPGQLNQ